jgi:hypothetical protein
MTIPDLLTAHFDQLLVNALAGNVHHSPVVKLFTPDGPATWFISVMDPDDPDRLFILCDLGSGSPELGYASLAELTTLRGPLGLPVERDEHSSPKNLCRSMQTGRASKVASSPYQAAPSVARCAISSASIGPRNRR